MGQSATAEGLEPLFVNTHGALVFAFNFSGQSYDRPMMNRLAAPAIGSGMGLVGLDGAGQAGMIRAEVRALGALAEAILMARIAPRTTPCHCRSACCSGKRPNWEWVNAIAFLADHVRQTAMYGCCANGLMRRDYVERYFTRKADRLSLEALAEKHDINRDTASGHFARVALLFGGAASRKGTPAQIGLEHVAMDAADQRLRDAGIVGVRIAA